MKKVLLFFSFLFIEFYSFATHNKGGEITYKCLGGYTYSITVTTYTKLSSTQADRCSLTVFLGTGDSALVCRSNGTTSPDPYGGSCINNTDCPNAATGDWSAPLQNLNIKKSVYSVIYTYPGPGNYLISMTDPNRSNGVVNVPDMSTFYLECYLSINPLTQNFNNSAQLSDISFEDADVGSLFTYNHGGYDEDGDSLVFSLIQCMDGPNTPISGYFIPTGVSVNSSDGNFIWNNPPNVIGTIDHPYWDEYSYAIKIEEWRCGILVGYVIRDFPISIKNSSNTSPQISAITDTTIIEGSVFYMNVSATDINNDTITLSAESYAFGLTPPPVFVTSSGKGSVSTTLSWQPGCGEIRKEPYLFLLKANDDFSNPPYGPLSDIESVLINVTGGPVQNLTANPWFGSITLNWTPVSCSNAIGYNIYRCAKILPGKCDSLFSSYSFIAFVQGATANYFIDYPTSRLWCYMVAPVYGSSCSPFVGLGSTTDSATSVILSRVDLVGLKTIRFYPNPSSEKIFFDFGEYNSFPLYFELFDLSGRKVIGTEIIKTNNSINVSFLDQGFYFFKFHDENQNSVIGKLEIIH